MHKKFKKNRTNIKGGYQSGRKVLTHNSKSDLPLTNWNAERPRLGAAKSDDRIA